jgi:probable addiction module antidote protein
MSTKTRDFNPFDYLDDPKDVREVLQDAWEDDDPEVFNLALGHLVKKYGVAEIAKTAGVGRNSLYKTIRGDVQPRLITIRKILKAVNIKVQFAV